MSFKFPDLCPYLTHMIHGHDPGGEGISSGRNYWTELRKGAEMIPTGGKEQWELLKSI